MLGSSLWPSECVKLELIVILICISCQFITYYGDFIPGEKAIMMVIKAFHAAACSWKMTLSGASPVTAMPLVWLRGLIGH